MKTMNILATAQAEHNLTTAPACAKELILSAIRSAVIRAKLDANELSTIGGAHAERRHDRAGRCAVVAGGYRSNHTSNQGRMTNTDLDFLALSPEFSEDRLALNFTDKFENSLRYVERIAKEPSSELEVYWYSPHQPGD